jgi:hypothetical protein
MAACVTLTHALLEEFVEKLLARLFAEVVAYGHSTYLHLTVLNWWRSTPHGQKGDVWRQFFDDRINKSGLESAINSMLPTCAVAFQKEIDLSHGVRAKFLDPLLVPFGLTIDRVNADLATIESLALLRGSAAHSGAASFRAEHRDPWKEVLKKVRAAVDTAVALEVELKTYVGGLLPKH